MHIYWISWIDSSTAVKHYSQSRWSTLNFDHGSSIFGCNPQQARNFVPTRASNVFMQKIALFIPKAYRRSRDRFDLAWMLRFLLLHIHKYAENLSNGMKLGIVEWQASIVLLDISHITLFSNTNLPHRWAPSHSPFFSPPCLLVRIADFRWGLNSKGDPSLYCIGRNAALPHSSVFSVHWCKHSSICCLLSLRNAELSERCKVTMFWT